MKTHTELGLTESELVNLKKVRDLLSSNAIEKGSRGTEDEKDVFNMAYSCSQKDHSCGSILCIGGWLKLFELDLKPDDLGIYAISDGDQDRISDYVDAAQAKPIGDLFWPSDEYGEVRDDINSITAHQAVRAIDNFLRTGKPNWSVVMEDVES